MTSSSLPIDPGFEKSNPYRYTHPRKNVYNRTYFHIPECDPRDLYPASYLKRNSQIPKSPQASPSPKQSSHLKSPQKKTPRKTSQSPLRSFAHDSSPQTRNHVLIPNDHSPLKKYEHSYHHNLAPVTHRLLGKENSHLRSFLKYGRIVNSKYDKLPASSVTNDLNKGNQEKETNVDKRGMMLLMKQ